MGKKYCTNCGTQIDLKMRFCWSCGVEIKPNNENKVADLEKESPYSPILNGRVKDKQGYIYALINASLDGLVKIGRTSRNPENRVNEISSATGVPTPFILIYQEYFEDCFTAESVIHHHLENKNLRVNTNREFFSITVNDAIEVIKRTKLELEFKSNNAMDYDSPEYQKKVIEELIRKGDSLIDGSNGIQDIRQGLIFLERAIKLGSSKACSIISDYYRRLESDAESDSERDNYRKRRLHYLYMGSQYSDIDGLKCLAAVAEMSTPQSNRYDNIIIGFTEDINPIKAAKNWGKVINSPILNDFEIIKKEYLDLSVSLHLLFSRFLSYYSNASKYGFLEYFSEHIPQASKVLNLHVYEIRDSILRSAKHWSDGTNPLKKAFITQCGEELQSLEQLCHIEYLFTPSFSVIDFKKIEEKRYMIECNIKEGLSVGDIIYLGIDNLLSDLMIVESVEVDGQALEIFIGNSKGIITLSGSINESHKDDADIGGGGIGTVVGSILEREFIGELYEEELNFEEINVITEKNIESTATEEVSQIWQNSLKSVTRPTKSNSTNILEKIKNVFSDFI